MTPGTEDSSPPPSYSQAMQQSTHYGRPMHATSHLVTTDETGQSSQGSSPGRNRPAASSSGGDEKHSGGADQMQVSPLEMIDRSAEEALQIQAGRVITDLLFPLMCERGFC